MSDSNDLEGNSRAPLAAEERSAESNTGNDAVSRKKSKDSPFLDMILDVIIPSLIWMKLSDPERLGPLNALLLGLSIPIAHGLYDLFIKKKKNLFSLLGITSLMLTGGFTLIELDTFWFAVKEAAIPFVLAIFVLLSSKGKNPLIEKLLYNESVFDKKLIESKIQNPQQEQDLHDTIRVTSYILAGSFLLSSVINFVLARVILTSPTGSTAFNEELAKMNLLSYPVIMLPCMLVLIAALVYFVKNLTRITSLPFSDMIIKK